MTASRFGRVALIGRPNAGKSTLVNRLTGEPVSIVTHKPQTTRHRIVGIRTRDDGQAVYVDTPGLHRRRDHALNRHLNRLAAETLSGVDLILLVVDATRQTAEDRAALRMARQAGVDCILVLNKIDRLADRAQLLPLTEELAAELDPVEVHYVSALRGEGVEALEEAVFAHLPEGPPGYATDEFTTHSERFLAAERIRAQLMENLHQEIPYGAAVVVESFERRDGRVTIGAQILLAEERHKAMVIGRGGRTLKRIGTRARAAIAELLGAPVHLELHVAVRRCWMDDEEEIVRLGYVP